MKSSGSEKANVQRSAFNVQRSAFSVQRSTFNVQRSTFNVQRSTFNVQRSTFDVQRSTFNVQRSTFTDAPPHRRTAAPLLHSLLILTLGYTVTAQEALRPSLSGQQALAQRERQAENEPYTVHWGDFKLLTTASVAGEWNDNVSLRNGQPEEDFILKPLLQLNASYPITSRNLLRFHLGVGYDQYLEHSQYSSLRLESGSELSFDMYVKDLWINLHDRFSFIRDSGQEAAVANTARYGGLDNTAGLSTTWDLQDVVLTLGYDHQNFISSASDYDYLNRASELLLTRAGLQVHPRLTVGVEATGSFTAYDQPLLNDSSGYSAGVYADWQPGAYFRLQPRAGYTAYLFDQTSRVIKAIDQDAWYAGLSLTHDITAAVSYSFNVGHELRLGIQADSIEDTYVRPSVTWKIVKNLSLSTYLSYENGQQGSRGQTSNFQEGYDWFGGGLNISHAITSKLTGAIYYRGTIRSSDASSRDYAQNVVGLRFNYVLQ